MCFIERQASRDDHQRHLSRSITLAILGSSWVNQITWTQQRAALIRSGTPGNTLSHVFPVGLAVRHRVAATPSLGLDADHHFFAHLHLQPRSSLYRQLTNNQSPMSDGARLELRSCIPSQSSTLQQSAVNTLDLNLSSRIPNLPYESSSASPRDTRRHYSH